MGLDAGYGIGSVKPGVCTSSTRPASPYNGQVIYETDTSLAKVWNGTTWFQLNYNYLDRSASGAVSGGVITSTTSYTVTFPSGRFTVAPQVTASAYAGQRGEIVFSNDPIASTTGFTFTVRLEAGEAATITRVSWIAVQNA
jgi:hypothetical protein